MAQRTFRSFFGSSQVIRFVYKIKPSKTAPIYGSQSVMAGETREGKRST